MGNGNTKEKKSKTEVKKIDIQDYKDYQKCNLLWLDKNVNNNENKYYKDFIIKIKQIKFDAFTEINDCINKLIEIKFEKTFVLISGSLANDFFIEIEKNINKFKVLPSIMIFTSPRKTNIVKGNMLNLNLQLFDINLIFYTFDPIKNQLKIKNVYSPKNIETKQLENDENFSFEYINKKEDLILPLYYPDLIDYPSKNEIMEFNEFLLDKYSTIQNLKELIEQLFLNITIPSEILLNIG